MLPKGVTPIELFVDASIRNQMHGAIHVDPMVFAPHFTTDANTDYVQCRITCDKLPVGVSSDIYVCNQSGRPIYNIGKLVCAADSTATFEFPFVAWNVEARPLHIVLHPCPRAAIAPRIRRVWNEDISTGVVPVQRDIRDPAGPRTK
jgi:hypothetical protein